MTQALLNSHGITADAFERMGDEADGYELVDGHLAEKAMSHLADFTSMQFVTELNIYLRRNPIGMAFGPESSYRLGVKNAARNARRPDASVLLNEQLVNGRAPRRGFDGAPVLAFESVSPDDRVTELEQKLQEYLAAGVPLIWVAYPELRMGRIVRPGEPFVAVPENGGFFDGGDVLPGLKIALYDVLMPSDRAPLPETAGAD